MIVIILMLSLLSASATYFLNNPDSQRPLGSYSEINKRVIDFLHDLNIDTKTKRIVILVPPNHCLDCERKMINFIENSNIKVTILIESKTSIPRHSNITECIPYQYGLCSKHGLISYLNKVFWIQSDEIIRSKTIID